MITEQGTVFPRSALILSYLLKPSGYSRMTVVDVDPTSVFVLPLL